MRKPPDQPPEWAGERLLTTLMQIVMRGAFGCLAAGVVVSLASPGAAAAMFLLTAGLVGLLALPVLKLLAILVTAARERDHVTVAATLAVIAILCALTFRDAVRS